MQPNHVTIEKTVGESTDETCYDVKVSFEHAEAVRDIFTNRNDFTHLYTIEISPPAEGSPQVTSIRIGSDGKAKMGPSVFTDDYIHEDEEDGVDGENVALKMERSSKMSVPLEGLSKDVDYIVRVSTVINGHTVAKKTEKLKAVNKKVEE